MLAASNPDVKYFLTGEGAIVIGSIMAAAAARPTAQSRSLAPIPFDCIVQHGRTRTTEFLMSRCNQTNIRQHLGCRQLCSIHAGMGTGWKTVWLIRIYVHRKLCVLVQVVVCLCADTDCIRMNEPC